MIIDWSKYDSAKAEEIAKRFGQNTLDEMKRNILSWNLVDQGKFLRTLKYTVKKDAHIVDRVQFAYEFYGKFFETGVKNAFGKGIELPIKPWRTFAFEKFYDGMNQEFADFYAEIIAQEVIIDNVQMKM